MGTTLQVPTDEIWKKVLLCFHRCLCDDDEPEDKQQEIIPETNLTGDLHLEEIDFLDLIFRLEKAFDIEIPRGEVYPEDIFLNLEFVEEGKVNADGLAELQKRYPDMDITAFCTNPDPDEFINHLTVADVYRYICYKTDNPCQLPTKPN